MLKGKSSVENKEIYSLANSLLIEQAIEDDRDMLWESRSNVQDIRLCDVPQKKKGLSKSVATL